MQRESVMLESYHEMNLTKQILKDIIKTKENDHTGMVWIARRKSEPR
jgi:hypothetical protein